MFTIDFTKPFLYKDIIYFNQGNLATNNILRCKLVTGGDITLNGYIAAVTFKTLSHPEINASATIVDEANCVIDIKFPSNALEVGVNELEIILNKGEGIDKVVTPSPVIKYEVWQCITTGNGIQGDNNYPILIDLMSEVRNTVRIANNASATADVSLKQAARMIEKVDNTLIKVNNTIEETNNAKDKALEAVKDVNRAIAAGTQDLEVKRARGKYAELKDRFDNLDKDLLNIKDTAIIPVVTENDFTTVEETVNGYLTNFKLEGKTLIVNSKNEEVPIGTEGATLKSVGDGVEEIVVLSFNSSKVNNIATFNDKYINYANGNIATTSGWCSSDFIMLEEYTPIVQNIKYTSPVAGIAFYDINKNFISGVNANNKEGDFKVVSPKGTKYLRCCDSKESNIDLYFGGKSETNYNYKFDKKKILYYDAETQLWKKPILRDSDSIEESSDGKYYYYKRSEERVYREGDESNSNVITDRVNTVYKLGKEKIYECSPVDLISYKNETNYLIESGPISPKSSFKYEGCVGNVINTLKEKVSYLEDKLYKTNLANFTVALNALDTKLKLEQLTKTPK